MKGKMQKLFKWLAGGSFVVTVISLLMFWSIFERRGFVPDAQIAFKVGGAMLVAFLFSVVGMLAAQDL